MKNSKTQTIVFSSLYFGGILSYNIFTLYSNSVEQLLEYRKTKQYFKNDLDAIVSGCQKDWFDNLLLSLFWPIRLPFKLIPIVILYFNSNDSNKTDSFIKYEVKKCISIKNINDTKKYIKTIDKMKNDNYESNKENVEYIKENTPIIKESDNEENTEINQNEDNETKINEDDTQENILNDNDKYKEKETNKNEENLNFNFSNFNEEISFDFSPSEKCGFNFSIKN